MFIFHILANVEYCDFFICLFLCKFNCGKFFFKVFLYFSYYAHCLTNIFMCEFFFQVICLITKFYVLIIKWIIYLRLANFSVYVAILSLLVNLSCKSSTSPESHFYYRIYDLKRYLCVFLSPRLEQYYIQISTYIT